MTSATLSMSSLSNQAVIRRQPVNRSLGRLAHAAPPLCVFFCLLLQIWIRIEIIRAGYRLEELRTMVLKNDVLKRELSFQYASAASPALIAEQAKKHLALEAIPPQRMRKLILEER